MGRPYGRAAGGGLHRDGGGGTAIAFTGDSSGGGLAITTQLRARERGLPLPAAALPFSPWVDMEAVGESYATNAERDPFFYAESVRQFAGLFLGEGGDPRDPLACPLQADLSGLGPIYIQAGGDVRLDVFPDMLHSFQFAAGRAPEATEAIRRMGDWVRPGLGL